MCDSAPNSASCGNEWDRSWTPSSDVPSAVRERCVECGGLLGDLGWEPEGICFDCLGAPQGPDLTRFLTPGIVTAWKGLLGR
jgi:hypothetical protein